MSDTFSLGACANQVKFTISGAQEQGMTILESLKILADTLRSPRKLLSVSDEKPLIEREKEGLFIVNPYEESNKISGYIQTEQAFARKFPFVLKERGLVFEFSPPKNEKITQNFLSASRIYRFFAIGVDTTVLELAFMPVSRPVQEHIQIAVEEEETKTIMTKEIEEADMPMVLEWLSELPSTCSISSNTAKNLALEIKNLREEKWVLEGKIQTMEADLIFQKNQNNALVSSLEEVKAEQRNQQKEMTNFWKRMEEESKKQMFDLMQAVRELKNNLAMEQIQKSGLESQISKDKHIMEQMEQEIEYLKLDNGKLQNTIKQHEETQARLKKVKITTPVNASANRHLFSKQPAPNSAQFKVTSNEIPFTSFQKLKEEQT